ncbi:ATP-dependent DNA helicase DinG [Dissostichus eleginoides]|uniref:ATP-dependent DNA helicase DinG n=1 Tax=Dissostichus eleginoides TaxID=100907 RepID=A0AAD9EUY3_DISEL|nr:ATP-dependent DNA helicase DinG [Dissostichus eleginoides]
MQRALFSRSALLAQQAAAALDGPLAARSAPLLLRLDRSMSSVSSRRRHACSGRWRFHCVTCSDLDPQTFLHVS